MDDLLYLREHHRSISRLGIVTLERNMSLTRLNVAVIMACDAMSYNDPT